MKRNFNLVRTIGKFETLQRTSDHLWNLTTLFDEWNKATGQKKRTVDFLELEPIKELTFRLTQRAENQGHSKGAKIEHLENIENQDIKKFASPMVLKTVRGHYGGTYVCDLLLIEAAAYLDVNLKIDILEQYRDNRIELRNIVADSYKDWTATLAKVGAKTQDDFSRCQKCINYAVFNKHHPDIRNNATTEQLNKMRDLEKQICQMVDFGYIKTLADVRGFLQKVWERDFPAPFTDPKD